MFCVSTFFPIFELLCLCNYTTLLSSYTVKKLLLHTSCLPHYKEVIPCLCETVFECQLWMYCRCIILFDRHHSTLIGGQ